MASASVLPLGLFCFLTVAAVEESVPGVVTVDALSFKRIANKRTQHILMRFDKRFSAHHKDFIDLSQRAMHRDDVMLAEMVVHHNDPYVEHADLARCISDMIVSRIDLIRAALFL